MPRPSGVIPVASAITDEVRQADLKTLTEWLAEHILNGDSSYTRDITPGLDYAAKGGIKTEFEENGTYTLLVEINGGARGEAFPMPGSRVYRSEDEYVVPG